MVRLQHAVLHCRFLSSRILHSLGGTDPPPLRKGRRALLLARRRNGRYVFGHHHHGEESHQVDPDRRRTLPADQYYPVLHGIRHFSTLRLRLRFSARRLTAASQHFSKFSEILVRSRVRPEKEKLTC